MKGRTCLACHKPLPDGCYHWRKGNEVVPYQGAADFAAKQMIWGLKDEERILDAVQLPDGEHIILVNPERAATLLATPKGAVAFDRMLREALDESGYPVDGEKIFYETYDLNDKLKGFEDRLLEDYYSDLAEEIEEEEAKAREQEEKMVG